MTYNFRVPFNEMDLIKQNFMIRMITIDGTADDVFMMLEDITHEKAKQICWKLKDDYSDEFRFEIAIL